MKLFNLIPDNFTIAKVLTQKEANEVFKEMENPCWKGYEMVGTKKKDGREVPNCVPVKENDQPGGYYGDQATENDEYDVENEQDIKEFIQFMRKYNKQLAEANCNCVYEAEYRGRKVQLGKPMQGDIKKFKVYVKNDKGNVVKVNFGFGGSSAHGKVMKIKKNNPERRASFRARHNCASPGPRWKARYWSCRKW